MKRRKKKRKSEKGKVKKQNQKKRKKRKKEKKKKEQGKRMEINLIDARPILMFPNPSVTIPNQLGPSPPKLKKKEKRGPSIREPPG